MKGWLDIRKRYIALEIVGIVGLIVCFTIGFCYDLGVAKGKIIIPVEDIVSFSLTLLQIQATIGTLIVAIIALITGNISDSYMGVSVSDYYLNIRPCILKQKVNIFISLSLTVISVIFHLLRFYNVVFYLFIATLIVISISIIEIYSVFRGKTVENIEIETYINYIIDSDVRFNKKANIYQNFVLDWKRSVDTQDKESYEKYFGVFKKCMLALWNYETDESLIYLQKQCHSMSYCLLSSEKGLIKERGIKFVQNIYDILWERILSFKSKEKLLIHKYKNGFYLFTEIGMEFINAINELNVEKVEKVFKFDIFSDSVQRNSIWLRYEDDNSEKDNKLYYDNEISELCLLAQQLGYYLSKKENNIINRNYWASMLGSWSIFSTYNIPQERCEDFLKDKCKLYFNYCYGLLLNGQEEILKQGLYLTGMKNTHKLDNKYHALFYLLVHCYIYYLAERESDNCISENIRLSAKRILSDIHVKNTFEYFLSKLSENEEWIDSNMAKQIHSILDRLELFPKYSYSKTMIMEYVVADFYLFIVLYMYHEYYMPEVLAKNIYDMDAFRYVSLGNKDNTKSTLTTLYKIINTGNKNDEEIHTEVELMFNELEKILKEKQKDRYIQSAREDQKNYETTINKEEICDKIRMNVINQIKDKFSPILVNTDTKNGIIKIDLLTLYDYTKSLGEKSIDGFYSHMDGSFLFGIEKFLYQRKAVDLKNRFDDFFDDKDYMNYLESNGLKMLLGSKFVLSNRNYRLSAEFNEFLEDYETIFTSVVYDGIALSQNAVQVCLHDVNVSIHSPSIHEANAKYSKQTGKYTYSITEGLPIDFEENELQEFLYNNRKVINVTAKVSIQVNKKPAGTVITGNKRT